MLYEYFSKVCNISEAHILMDQKTEKSRGVGFVHCTSNQEARKGIEFIVNEDRCKDGFDLNVKFAKIPRAERSVQRERKRKDQSREKGSKKQSSKDVGERESLPPIEGSALRPQESKNNIKQDNTLTKRNWYKCNEPQLLAHDKGLQLPSSKIPKRISKSKWRKNVRRKQFQKQQMKKVLKKRNHNLENFNISKVNGHQPKYQCNQQDQTVSTNMPFVSGKPNHKPKITNPVRERSNRTEQCFQLLMPNINMTPTHLPQQMFVTQQYNTVQVNANVMGNCVLNTHHTSPLSTQGTVAVGGCTQTPSPFEYAASVASTVSSTMSSPLGPTPMSYNTLYKQEYRSRTSVGCRASCAERTGHQVNIGNSANNNERNVLPPAAPVRQQIGLSPCYCWPDSPIMTHVVNPYGVAIQSQQQGWCTDSCSSVDSFCIANDDYSRYSQTTNQLWPGGMMHYPNIQAQNPVIQTKSVWRPEFQTFDPPTYQVQHPMVNFFASGVDTRSDTTSTHSGIGGQPLYFSKLVPGGNMVATAQKILVNHNGIGNNCNGGDALATTDLHSTTKIKSSALDNPRENPSSSTTFHCWSTATSCNTEASSVKNVNQCLRSNESFQRKSRLQLGSLPVKVKVISDVNSSEPIGFNQKRKISKSRFTGFKQKVKMLMGQLA